MPLTVHSSQHMAWPHGWLRTVRGWLMQMVHDSPSSSCTDGGAAAGRLFDEDMICVACGMRPGRQMEQVVWRCFDTECFEFDGKTTPTSPNCARPRSVWRAGSKKAPA